MKHKPKLSQKKEIRLKVKDILKTEGIITLGLNQKLAEAASRFQSSHDAIVVLSDEQVKGLVCPYYTMIKRVYPPRTKLANCLFSQPKIYLDTTLAKVARLMLESKVHYLPVMDDKSKLIGLVTARRILETFLDYPQNEDQVTDIVNNKQYLQTVNLNCKFDEVLRFFQNTKLSKLVVVNRQNNLQGIISMFDLLPLFQEPKQRKSFYDRGEDFSQFDRYAIKNFLKRSTIQVTSRSKLKQVTRLILDKEIGSVIVMKNRLQPSSIVTTSDLLRYFNT